MNEIVFDVCRIVATIIGIVVAYYVIPALKTVVREQLDSKTKEFIKTCVYAAQQIYKKEDTALKKKYVLNIVIDWLNENNIPFTNDQLDILIESAVLAMKTETK